MEGGALKKASHNSTAQGSPNSDGTEYLRSRKPGSRTLILSSRSCRLAAWLPPTGYSSIGRYDGCGTFFFSPQHRHPSPRGSEDGLSLPAQLHSRSGPPRTTNAAVSAPSAPKTRENGRGWRQSREVSAAVLVVEMTFEQRVQRGTCQLRTPVFASCNLCLQCGRLSVVLEPRF